MARTRTYSSDENRKIAMPLGGIGTGQVSIGGDGALRQWQIFNQVNHDAYLPGTFFGIRVTQVEPPLNAFRILQARPTEEAGRPGTDLARDDYLPPEMSRLLASFSGVERTIFRGLYPRATVEYQDEGLPIDVSLAASSPMVPLDADLSSIPAIECTFRVESRASVTVYCLLAAAIQNAIGWDGITDIEGNRCPLFGGNTNRVDVSRSRTDLIMENPSLADDDPGVGQMVLSALTPGAIAHERWTESSQFVRFLQGNHGKLRPYRSATDSLRKRSTTTGMRVPQGPSPEGQTWNGGLAVPFALEPGESREVTFVISWSFPNRYLNFDQYGWHRRDYGMSRFWLGNHYSERFPNAIAVVDLMESRPRELDRRETEWIESLESSSLSPWLTEAMAAQPAIVRSPSCFQTPDGKFFGFEGARGYSTGMSNGLYGGSCPLNCTHVWNYEQGMSQIFPALERTMRDTEFDYAQAPEGYLPHRIITPLYLKQLWGETIGGPEKPAIDGMLGALLKTYREVRHGASLEWLKQKWPKLRALLDFIRAEWDANHSGVLRGEQPVTFDISVFGVNSYVGTLWLAALRACEEMAMLLGEGAVGRELHDLYVSGRDRYDELLWNGEFYAQELTPDEARKPFQWGDGCLSDQVIGQWWAHQLDLGYILPRDRIRSALDSIVRYNFRSSFDEFEHSYRAFAVDDDSGLLVCSWPNGGRPEVPVRYADEVWIGSEFQVAAHCYMEGLDDLGDAVLGGLESRYNGQRGNLYNPIECGDYYTRALAGWSIVDSLSGFRFDSATRRLSLHSGFRQGEYPFLAGTAWGRLRTARDHVRLEIVSGSVEIDQLRLPLCPTGVERGTSEVSFDPSEVDSSDWVVTPSAPIRLGESEDLTIRY